MTHAVEGSFLIISTSFATLRPLVRGVKQQVASLPMVSRLATKRQSTGAARSGGARSNQSHVDVIDFVRNAREKGTNHELRSNGSYGALIECNCSQQDEDTVALDRRARTTCVECGREIGSGRDTARSTVSGLTWMEMMKS